jgi:hypothetical protein
MTRLRKYRRGRIRRPWSIQAEQELKKTKAQKEYAEANKRTKQSIKADKRW